MNAAGCRVQWTVLVLWAATAAGQAQETGTVTPTAVRSLEQLIQADVVPAQGEIPGKPVSAPRHGPTPRPLKESADQPIDWSLYVKAEEITAAMLPASTHPALAPTLSFSALPDNNGAIPPDTYGAAGPSHLMTMINTQVRVQDKTGTNITTLSLRSFWNALPGSPFDTRVQFDAFHQRWIAVCGSSDGNNNDTSRVNFAISATADPTGLWTFYQFNGDSTLPGNFADYPCLGFNKTWIAITASMFTTASTPVYQGARMWVIDKASALAGGSLTLTTYPTKFDLVGGVSGFTLQPCVTYGADATLYVVDNTGYYRSSDTTFLLRLSRITGTGPAPVWSVVTPSVNNAGLFLVANNFNTTSLGATQSGTAAVLDAGDTRVMNAICRNGNVWLAHAATLPAKLTPAVTRNAVFWYRLNPSGMPSPIVQSGVIDGGPGIHHMYPSIAANAANDAVVGFTRTDVGRFAEAVYTGRLTGDPAGSMRGLTVFKTGESSYSKFFSGTKNRWGDYSYTSVDPSDETSFWTIQQYAATNVGSGTNDGRWGTWWAKVDPSTALGDIDPSYVPYETSLMQNYPNPFNPTTTIEYRLSRPGRVLLTVFDVVGREVTILVDEEEGVGRYAVPFTGSGLSSGIYFYRLEAGGSVLVRRMALLR